MDGAGLPHLISGEACGWLGSLYRGEECPQVLIQDGLLAHAAEGKVLQKPGGEKQEPDLDFTSVSGL